MIATLLGARPGRRPAGAGLVLRRDPVAGVRHRAGGGRLGLARGSPAGAFAAPDEPLDLPRAVVGGLLTFIAYGVRPVRALSRAPLAIVAPLRESAVVLTSAWGVVVLARGRRPARGRVPARGVGARARRRRGARDRPLSRPSARRAVDVRQERPSASPWWRHDAAVDRETRRPRGAHAPLRLGYKASAEQFPPRRLLDLAIAAEQRRLRLRLDERPLPALAPHGRPRPERARLAGRRGGRDAAG